MHRGTKKRAENIKCCDLALFKNPGNICDHMHSKRHRACNVHIFSVDIFSVLFLH